MVGNFEKCTVENSVINAIIINADSLGPVYKESFILPSVETINVSDLKCLAPGQWLSGPVHNFTCIQCMNYVAHSLIHSFFL